MKTAASTTRTRAVRARRREARGEVGGAGLAGVDATARTYKPAALRRRGADPAHTWSSRMACSAHADLRLPLPGLRRALRGARAQPRRRRRVPVLRRGRGRAPPVGLRRRRRVVASVGGARHVAHARTSAPAAVAPAAAATTRPHRLRDRRRARPSRDARLRERRAPQQRRRRRSRRAPVARGGRRAPRARGGDRRVRGGRRGGPTGSSTPTTRIAHAARLRTPTRSRVVENATRAWDMAFYALRFGPGDRILTSQAEYASNYIALLPGGRPDGRDGRVDPDDDPAGGVDVAALEAMLDERVKLVALVHVPTHGGLVEPGRGGRGAHARGGRPVPPRRLPVGRPDAGRRRRDRLRRPQRRPGRKFLRGPRGTGFLYVRRALIERLEPPLLDLHAAEWLDDGSLPDPPRRAALRELGVQLRREDRPRRRGRLRDAAGASTRSATASSRSPRRCASALGRHARRARCTTSAREQVRDRDVLARRARRRRTWRRRCASERVNVSVSPAAYSLVDFARRGLDDMVRASVHYYNDDDELDRLVAVTRRLRAGRRSVDVLVGRERQELGEVVAERDALEDLAGLVGPALLPHLVADLGVDLRPSPRRAPRRTCVARRTCRGGPTARSASARSRPWRRPPSGC